MGLQFDAVKYFSQGDRQHGYGSDDGDVEKDFRKITIEWTYLELIYLVHLHWGLIQDYFKVGDTNQVSPIRIR